MPTFSFSIYLHRIPGFLLSISLILHQFVGGYSGGAATVTEFDFGTLTLSSLKLLGDAHLSNGSVRLTRDLPVPNSGAGRVLYSRPVRFRLPGTRSLASFTTFFSFSVRNLNPSSIGGGLAFVITPNDESVGAAGAFLGLENPNPGSDPGVRTPSGFVAVEFDTLMDVEFKDINGNHVGLDLDSMVSHQVGDLGAIDVDLKSGDSINCWVEFDGSTQDFNVSVSYSNVKPKDPILSVNLDLDQYLSDFMFVGFSGSTQGSTETHNIEWWSFSSSFDDGDGSPAAQLSPPTASLIVPTDNSTHPPPPSMAPETSPHGAKSGSSRPSSSSSSSWQTPGAVAGVVTASAFFLALCAGTLIWVFGDQKQLLMMRAVSKRSSSESWSFAASEIMKMPKEFSYKELRVATRGFDSDRIIGHGAFGTVYRGILPQTGDVVAVKRCSHSGDQGKKTEFLSELSIIGTLRHRNLVRLQGWCHDKGEILLVYDLMPNGSLDKALFESSRSRRMVLPWPHRRKILLGVASALTYLHQECENQVIHRDVKASNIMLDEGFNARLGDFGLAREIEHDKSPDATVAAGTMGYLAPEYLLTGRATEKTDVFSFGAVVLEVATGRRPIESSTTTTLNNYQRREEEEGGGGGGYHHHHPHHHHHSSSSLVEWVWSLHREGRLLMAADARLGGEFDEGEMRRVLLVGLACSHPDPSARPAMRGVIQMLVGEAEVPMVPRAKPSMSYSTSQLLLSLQDTVSDCNAAMLTISTSSSSDHITFTGNIS
ncbi:L-type lectin-domain containing receptor kinase VIII.1 [Dionaea muscipula]